MTVDSAATPDPKGLVEAVVEATRVEIDAPSNLSHKERVAWADGYTTACDDIRAVIEVRRG